MEKLGIDTSVMVFQMVNFAFLVFVLNKFLYKPVVKAIKAKKEELAQIDAQKAELTKKEEELARQQEEIVANAKKQKQEILREARLEALKAKKEALAKAEKEAAKLIEKAQKDIEAEKSKMARDFDKQVLLASTAIVEKVIEEKIPEKDIDETYKKLKQVESHLRGTI